MLTQLATLKARLKIEDAYVLEDALLTNFINLVSGRFARECNRIFDRAPAALEEFPADELEVRCSRYPVESVATFKLKTTEVEGWIVQTGIDYLIKNFCIVSLLAPLGAWRQRGQITYAGGYVLPGATPGAGQTALPAELEQSCIEQCAYLFQNRNRLGMLSVSGEGGSINQFAQLDLLPSVKKILQKYERWLN